jgi:NAD+ synthase
VILLPHELLEIDIEKEVYRIGSFVKDHISGYRKDGAIIGLSGGVDSAVVSEILVESLGKENVKGLILPEKESNPISKELGIRQAEKLGIEYDVFDITGILEAFGTYRLRDEAVKKVFPDFNENCTMRMVLPGNLLENYSFNVFTMIITHPDGREVERRLPKGILDTILAATDTKQRTRMMSLYYHGESMYRSVVGTTNRPETLQGFFVRYGDGGVDIEPIAHLYKTQVYQLAEHFNVVREIIEREPSPDTFSFPVSDQDFFFRLPYEIVDIMLYCWENEKDISEASRISGLKEDRVEWIYKDFDSKYKATEYLRELAPSLL